MNYAFDEDRLRILRELLPSKRFDQYFAAENLYSVRDSLHQKPTASIMQNRKGPGVRIVTGFAVVIGLTLLISAWSYYHISTLGESTEHLFLANYRSVQYAGTMEKIVEQLVDSDSLATEFIRESQAKFAQTSRLEHANITEKGELELILKIDAEFEALIATLGRSADVTHHLQVRATDSVLASIEALIHLNERAMFSKAANIRSQASFARESSIGITVLLCTAAIFLAVGVSRRSLAEFRELDLAKSNFVATAAHELKTPLSTIKTTTDMLLGGLGGALPVPAQPLLHRIQSEAIRLISLVSDLLDLAKLDTGQFVLRRTTQKATDLLEAAAVHVSMAAGSAGVEIDVAASPFDLVMDVDENKIGHALTNLLSNAIKYADRGSHIELKATEVDSEVWLTVTNHGKPIPEQLQQAIFNKFVQVEGGAMGIGKGSGLGLAIAKEIVTLHRGRIWVDSKPDGLTTFTIALPQRLVVPTPIGVT